MSKHAQDVPDVNHVVKACEAMLARGDVEAALHEIEGALKVWPHHRTLRHRCATALRRLGRHADAVPFLESLLHDGPFSPGVASELATALKQVGEVDRAEVICQQALDAQPDHEVAQAVLIEIALGRKDVAAALVRSEAAVMGRPESRLLRHRHATCLQRSGQYAAASSILEGLHAEQPANRTFSMELASVSRHLGHIDRAEALYLAILDNSPNDEAAQAGLIEIALQRGEIDAALSRSETALAEQPKSRLLRHRRATCLRRAGNHAEARPVLEALHADQPANLAFALELASVLRQQGEAARAEDLYSECLAMSPNNEGALAGLIEIALWRGEIEAALSRSRQALGVAPTSRLLRHRHATCLQRSGAFPEAREALEKLHAEAPENDAFAVELAAVVRHLGDPEKAELLYAKVLADAPDNERALAGRVELAQGRGDIEIALTLAMDALKVQPESRLLRHRYANCLRAAGRHRDARAILQELHLEAVDHAQFAIDLALCCKQLGELDTAERLFRQALIASPASPAALQGLVSIAEARGDTRAMIALLEERPTNDAAELSTASAPPHPVRALRLADLLIKAGDTQRATETLRSLEPHADPLSEDDLALFIRLADRLGLDEFLPDLIDRVRSRDTVRLNLALTVFRLAIASEEPRLIEQVERELLRQIHPMDRLHFCAEATMLRHGPFEALDGLLEARQPRRSSRDAHLLARFLLYAGRTRLALRYLCRCTRRWPNVPNFRAELTSAFIVNGQLEEALAWLDLHTDQIEPSEMSRLRLRVLMQMDAREAALEIIDGQIGAGARTPGSTEHLQVLISLHRLEEADQAADAVRNRSEQSRSRAAHFSTTKEGKLLTELRMYRLVESQVRTAEDHADLVATNFHAAADVVQGLTQHSGPQPTPASHDDIPRRIIQYWDATTVPAEIGVTMRSWQAAAGWSHVLYNRQSARRWLAETFGPDHARAFALARHPAEEADFLRLCLLFEGGGIYADADDLLLGRPNDILAEGPGLVLFTESYGAVANNLICAPPGHPVLGRAMGMAREALLRRDNDIPWLKTGPGLITRALALHVMAGGGADVTLRPSGRLLRHVKPIVQMSYKATSRYWDAQRKKETRQGVIDGFKAMVGAGCGTNEASKHWEKALTAPVDVATLTVSPEVSATPCQSSQLTGLHMQDAAPRMTRPKLTLPAEAAALLREEYEKADVILEYGSGGSTVVAGEMPGKTVFSVESDANWAKMMQDWFAENPPAAKVNIHHVDIGPTKEWGYPVDNEKWRNFIDYPFSPWDNLGPISPDVVLIDGRFRIGCFLASSISAKKPTSVLFDDYVGRPHYHVVESYFKPLKFAGRMAHFMINPLEVKNMEVTKMASFLADVR